MRRRLLLPLTLGFAALAFASKAEPLSSEAFERHTQGMTIDWQQAGALFGREEYQPNRKVIWQMPDGTCLFGSWYPDATDQICFLYEDYPDPQCWRFSLQDGRLIAMAEGASFNQEAQQIGQPQARALACSPKVGA